jgi:hypothetical protein
MNSLTQGLTAVTGTLTSSTMEIPSRWLSYSVGACATFCGIAAKITSRYAVFFRYHRRRGIEYHVCGRGRLLGLRKWFDGGHNIDAHFRSSMKAKRPG